MSDHGKPVSTFGYLGIMLGLGVIGCLGLTSRPALAESETRPLGSFSKLQISTGVTGTVVCGSPARAVVTADPASGIQRLKTEIDDNTLTIRYRGMGFWSGSASVVITTPDPLEAIEASSGSALKVEGCSLSPSQLAIQASSGASLTIGDGRSARVEIRGSSGASISANDLHADASQIEASSGASIKACKLRASTSHASSGASITTAKDSANRAETSSGGSISDSGC